MSPFFTTVPSGSTSSANAVLPSCPQSGKIKGHDASDSNLSFAKMRSCEGALNIHMYQETEINILKYKTTELTKIGEDVFRN